MKNTYKITERKFTSRSIFKKGAYKEITIKELTLQELQQYCSNNHVCDFEIIGDHSIFTMDELLHIRDHLSHSFRGVVCNNTYYEGEYAQDLVKSIKTKLNIK